MSLLYLSPEERKQVHVLVVEDNPINQTIAIKNIRKLGFPVTAVWNGREALSYLLKPSLKQPRPSIILMDVQMPVMDGYEATRTLRRDLEYARDNYDSGAQLDGEDLTRRERADAAEGTDIVPGKEKENAKDVAVEHGSMASSSELDRLKEKKKRRYLLRDIPVIAMTASAIQGDREKCHDAGMDDYLAKPVEKARLEEMLLKWAGRRREGCDGGR